MISDDFFLNCVYTNILYGRYTDNISVLRVRNDFSISCVFHSVLHTINAFQKMT